jgi:hypothetical protein
LLSPPPAIPNRANRLFFYRKADPCMSDTTPDLPGTPIAPGMSDARRNSLRLHLTSVRVNALGLFVLTLVVLYVLFVTYNTRPDARREQFNSMERMLVIAWACGLAVSAVGRAISMFDILGNKRRGLPVGMLGADVLSLLICYLLAGTSRGNVMLGMPTYFLATALYAAYLGRVADEFHMADVPQAGRQTARTNLATTAFWIFILCFAPRYRQPVDTGFQMFAALACLTSLWAHGLQILLLYQFGGKAARRLDTERLESLRDGAAVGPKAEATDGPSDGGTESPL